MNKKTLRFILLAMAILMIMATTGCGLRYKVKGKAIDMDTGQPLEGALVSIIWRKDHLRLPGLGRNWDVLEHFDCITGSNGKFEIPKRLLRTYHLAVYKKGYVCWESKDIFPTYENRKTFRLKKGMIIELEPFRESYSKTQHACWVVRFVYDNNSELGKYKGNFFKAIEEEREICKKMWEK